MITLLSGTPGSGKSLDVAIDLYDRIKKSSMTIGNFEINVENVKGKKKGHFLYIDNLDLTVQRLILFSRNYSRYKKRQLKEGELLLVIDEAQLLFNSREWQSPQRKEWLAFLTQHRKYFYDIYMVAQFDKMLDRQVRSLVEYEIVHRKVNNFGKTGKLMALGGSLFVKKTVWYPMKQKLGSSFFRGHKKFFEIYNTYKLFDSCDELGNERGPSSEGLSDERVKKIRFYNRLIDFIKSKYKYNFLLVDIDNV